MTSSLGKKDYKKLYIRKVHEKWSIFLRHFLSLSLLRKLRLKLVIFEKICVLQRKHERKFEFLKNYNDSEHAVKTKNASFSWIFRISNFYLEFLFPSRLVFSEFFKSMSFFFQDEICGWYQIVGTSHHHDVAGTNVLGSLWPARLSLDHPSGCNGCPIDQWVRLVAGSNGNTECDFDYVIYTIVPSEKPFFKITIFKFV